MNVTQQTKVESRNSTRTCQYSESKWKCIYRTCLRQYSITTSHFSSERTWNIQILQSVVQWNAAARAQCNWLRMDLKFLFSVKARAGEKEEGAIQTKKEFIYNILHKAGKLSLEWMWKMWFMSPRSCSLPWSYKPICRDSCLGISKREEKDKGDLYCLRWTDFQRQPFTSTNKWGHWVLCFLAKVALGSPKIWMPAVSSPIFHGYAA